VNIHTGVGELGRERCLKQRTAHFERLPREGNGLLKVDDALSYLRCRRGIALGQIADFVSLVERCLCERVGFRGWSRMAEMLACAESVRPGV